MPFRLKLLQPSHDPETLKPPRYPKEEPCVGGATPGTRVASEKNVRPFRGISVTRVLSTTAPNSADIVFTVSESAETVTVSVTAPTSSVKSNRAFCATVNVRSGRVRVLKPCIDISMSYVPGGRNVN